MGRSLLASFIRPQTERPHDQSLEDECLWRIAMAAAPIQGGQKGASENGAADVRPEGPSPRFAALFGGTAPASPSGSWRDRPILERGSNPQHLDYESSALPLSYPCKTRRTRTPNLSPSGRVPFPIWLWSWHSLPWNAGTETGCTGGVSGAPTIRQVNAGADGYSFRRCPEFGQRKSGFTSCCC